MSFLSGNSTFHLLTNFAQISRSW